MKLLIVLSALVLSSAAMTSDNRELYEYPSHEEMLERLSRCGLTNVEIFEDRETQIDIVRIGDTGLGRPALECIAEATVWSVYDLEFTDDEVRKTYLDVEVPFQDRVAEARSLARRQELAEYFAARTELGAPPSRSDGESDFELARRIESYCGPAAIGALAGEYGAFTLDPPWLNANLPPTKDALEAVTCVLNVLEWNGIPIGFVGNERIAPEAD